MIPRLHKRGTSFKGACGYILHDAQTTSRDRVLWSDTRNLVSKADDVWFEMFATARDQALLKQQAGQDARGRKNTKPVMHYSLSWADTESPSPEHMKETALASLKALGLEGHQAVMAAHGDKQHLHVHIVVNTIHPETGLTAPLKYTKERLSRWAQAYEQEHGLHCHERVSNNAERDRVRSERDPMTILCSGSSRAQLTAPPPYVPVKHKAATRAQWIERKEITDRMKRLRAELDLVHRAERDVTWQRHKQQRDALDRNTKAAVDNVRAHFREEFRPYWKDLYRAHKAEARFIARTHPLERAVFVFSNRARLGNGKPLSLRQATPLIAAPAKLLDRLEAVHTRERRDLATTEKSEAKTYTEKIWTQHAAKFARLRDEQAAERQSERGQQYAKTRGVSFALAKASLLDNDRHQPAPELPSREFRQGAVPAQLHETFSKAAGTPVLSDEQSRAEQIRARMNEWRRRNEGRDFGREL